MRSVLPALLAAAALLLTACTGSDSQSQPQTSSPAPVQQAVQQAEQQQQTQPADQPQPTAATANQPETESNEQTEQTAPAAAEPQPAAQRAETDQTQQGAQQAAQQAAQPQPAAQQANNVLALWGEAQAALAAWADDLRSVKLAVDLDLNPLQRQTSATVALQFWPFQLYTTVDLNARLADELSLRITRGAPLGVGTLRLLLLEDAAWLGWPAVPIGRTSPTSRPTPSRTRSINSSAPARRTWPTSPSSTATCCVCGSVCPTNTSAARSWNSNTKASRSGSSSAASTTSSSIQTSENC